MEWRVSLFAVALFAFVVAWGWATSSTGLCDLQIARVASTACLAQSNDEDKSPCAKDGTTNCFEFWINRYQSTLAAIVAVIAALMAWIGVKRQIDAAQKQVEIANRQFAASALAPLQQREQVLRALHSCLTGAFFDLNESSQRVRESAIGIHLYLNRDGINIGFGFDVIEGFEKKFDDGLSNYYIKAQEIESIIQSETLETSVREELLSNKGVLKDFADRLKISKEIFHFIRIIRNTIDEDYVKIFWNDNYEISVLENDLRMRSVKDIIIRQRISTLENSIDATIKTIET